MSSVFLGYKCSNPACNSTVDVIAMAGDDQAKCSNCGSEMIPDPQGKTSSANVHCANCNSSYGFINSDKCPGCGNLF